jgi:hypothetical protein
MTKIAVGLALVWVIFEKKLFLVGVPELVLPFLAPLALIGLLGYWTLNTSVCFDSFL